METHWKLKPLTTPKLIVSLPPITRALDWPHRAIAHPHPTPSFNRDCHIALLQSWQDYFHSKLLSKLTAASCCFCCSIQVLLDSKLLHTVCSEAFPLRNKWTDCNILGPDRRLWNWRQLHCAMSSKESGRGCSKGRTGFCTGAPKSAVYVSRSTWHCKSSCIWLVCFAPW